ncbi:hypothetical protein BHU24_02060 [Bacillus pseudomycoides]|nr:hypothetical protein [Bacillus pseudomycoides]PEF22860.1 hypothetical protein CON69_19965 [Bacillus pseudomycoides]PEO81282.1 hypothetical protein CN571_26120 [Bacillus pseudomycoides]PFZ97651.1 hypothetical protein COL70_04250 [Bacillus pseudomycoides]PGD70997.1 hypothetical protein COM46_26750 [Bacillus pseudomycoides]
MISSCKFFEENRFVIINLAIYGVAPHIHQFKNFITSPKQKNCTFSPEDINFFVLGDLPYLA